MDKFKFNLATIWLNSILEKFKNSGFYTRIHVYGLSILSSINLTSYIQTRYRRSGKNIKMQTKNNTRKPPRSEFIIPENCWYFISAHIWSDREGWTRHIVLSVGDDHHGNQELSRITKLPVNFRIELSEYRW